MARETERWEAWDGLASRILRMFARCFKFTACQVALLPGRA